MQHGTGREKIQDEVENAIAITTQAEVRSVLVRVLEVLGTPTSLDQAGVWGPDYGPPLVTLEERREAEAIRQYLLESEGIDSEPPWEMSPEPYEPNPYDGTYSEE